MIGQSRLRREGRVRGGSRVRVRGRVRGEE